eukprot:3598282-Amphidinium_carterae.1
MNKGNLASRRDGRIASLACTTPSVDVQLIPAAKCTTKLVTKDTCKHGSSFGYDVDENTSDGDFRLSSTRLIGSFLRNAKRQARSKNCKKHSDPLRRLRSVSSEAILESGRLVSTYNLHQQVTRIPGHAETNLQRNANFFPSFRRDIFNGAVKSFGPFEER